MFQTVRILDSYRLRSEDHAEIIQHKAGLVIVVADGAGGMTGGDEAADTIMMWVKAFASRTERLHNPAQWRDLLAKLDFQVSCGNGQTTAVVAAVTEEGICGASVGDSAAWTISPDGCCDLTKDQVQKPLLGSGAAKPVAFEKPGFDGTLLVASDGLVKYAARDRICATAIEKDLTAAGRHVIDLARLRSGTLQDDVAIVLCRRSANGGSVC